MSNTIQIIIKKASADKKLSINLTITNGEDVHVADLVINNPADHELAANLAWYFERSYADPVHIKSVEQSIRKRGGALFEELFQNGQTAGIWKTIETSLDQFDLVIRYPPGSDRIFPWILLFNTKTKELLVNQIRSFSLAFGHTVPGKEAIQGRLRILLITARPSGSQDVPLRSIANLLIKNHRSRRHISFALLRQPTPEHLGAKLNEAARSNEPFQIVHFDGHGVYRDEHGCLVFENDHEDKPVYTEAGTLGPILQNGGVRLFVMNACKSDYVPVEAFDTDAKQVPTLAQELSRYDLDAIVAMKYDVEVLTAQKFIGSFYSKIFLGQSIKIAFTHALKSILTFQTGYQQERSFDMAIPTLIIQKDIRFAIPQPGLLDKLAYWPNKLRFIHFDRFPGVFDDLILQLERAFVRSPVVHLYGCLGSGRSRAAKLFREWALKTGLRKNIVYISKKDYRSGRDAAWFFSKVTDNPTSLLIFDDADMAGPNFFEPSFRAHPDIGMLVISNSSDFNAIFSSFPKIQALLDPASIFSLFEYYFQSTASLLKTVDLSFIIKKCHGNLLTGILFSGILKRVFKQGTDPINIYQAVQFSFAGVRFPDNEIDSFETWFSDGEFDLLLRIHVVGEWFTEKMIRYLVSNTGGDGSETGPVITKLRNKGLLIEYVAGYAFQLHPYITPHLRKAFEKWELAKQNLLLEALNRFFFVESGSQDFVVVEAFKNNAVYIARCFIRQKYSPFLHRYAVECRHQLNLTDKEWIDLLTRGYAFSISLTLDPAITQAPLEDIFLTKICLARYHIELATHRLEYEKVIQTMFDLRHVFERMEAEFSEKNRYADNTAGKFMELLLGFGRFAVRMYQFLPEEKADLERLAAFLMRFFNAFLQRTIRGGHQALSNNQLYLDEITVLFPELGRIFTSGLTDWYDKMLTKKDYYDRNELSSSVELSFYFNRFPSVLYGDERSFQRRLLNELSSLNHTSEEKTLLLDRAASLNTRETVLGENFEEYGNELLKLYQDALEKVSDKERLVNGVLHSIKDCLALTRAKLCFFVFKPNDVLLLFDQSLFVGPEMLEYLIAMRVEEWRGSMSPQEREILYYFESIYASMEEKFRTLTDGRAEVSLGIDRVKQLLFAKKVNEAFRLYETLRKELESTGDNIELVIFKIEFLSFLYICADFYFELEPYGTPISLYIKEEIAHIQDDLLPWNKIIESADIKKGGEKLSEYFEKNLLIKKCSLKLTIISHAIDTEIPLTRKITALIKKINKEKSGVTADQMVNYCEEILKFKEEASSIEQAGAFNSPALDLLNEIETLPVIIYLELVARSNTVQFDKLVAMVSYTDKVAAYSSRNSKLERLSETLMRILMIHLAKCFQDNRYDLAELLIQGCDLLLRYLRSNKIDLDNFPEVLAQLGGLDKVFLERKKTEFHLYLLNISVTTKASPQGILKAMFHIKTVNKMYRKGGADGLRYNNVQLTFHDYKVYWYYHLLTLLDPSVEDRPFGELQDVFETLKQELVLPSSVVLDALQVDKKAFALVLYRAEYYSKKKFEERFDEVKKTLSTYGAGRNPLVFEQ